VRLLRPRSFLRTGLPASLWSPLDWLPNPRSGTPRSGYRGSDLVHWHKAGIFGAAAKLSLIVGLADPLGRAAQLPQLEPRSEAIEGNFGDDPLDIERIPQKLLS